MSRQFIIIFFAFLLFCSGIAKAQNRQMATLNQAIRSQWVQFNIVGGRIQLHGSQIGSFQTSTPSLSHKDQLSINSDSGETVMTYEWSNSKELFSINATAGGRVHLRRTQKKEADGLALEFKQNPQEKLIFTLGSGAKQQVIVGDSLWHLFIFYPEESRKHLAPFLQVLQPNWKLAELADLMERNLLRAAENPLNIDRSKWARWVIQLGDENYARRQAADRELRSANPALMVYLQQLDFERLDAEQQFRVRRIMDVLSAKISFDSAEQVAIWLSGDATIWQALLHRSDVAVRRVAAKQLSAILQSPIPVDPEADPANQKTQFEQLQTRIESLSVLEKE